jgi:hypothetical protein
MKHDTDSTNLCYITPNPFVLRLGFPIIYLVTTNNTSHVLVVLLAPQVLVEFRFRFGSVPVPVRFDLTSLVDQQ